MVQQFKNDALCTAEASNIISTTTETQAMRINMHNRWFLFRSRVVLIRFSL